MTLLAQIFALYGETLEIAHALIKHYIIANNLTQVEYGTRMRDSGMNFVT